MKQQALDTDLILRSAGTAVENEDGDRLGEIVEVTKDGNEKIEYLILASINFLGRNKRYFAVPVSSSVMEIDDDNTIVLKLQKDDLLFARGVAASNCPKPERQFGRSIFEIYYYREPADRETGSGAGITTKRVI